VGARIFLTSVHLRDSGHENGGQPYVYIHVSVTLNKETEMKNHVSGQMDSVALLGEQVFFSKDVAQIARISLRQLQWWDEKKVVSAEQQDHRRMYSRQQVVEILAIAAFRRKGMSLQKIRRVMRSLRLELNQHFSRGFSDQPALYVLTDGKSLHLEEEPLTILNLLSEAKTGMYLFCLNDWMKAITSKKVPRRHLTTQLSLFSNRKKPEVR
jgi:DNA-binding transcriptional MerR regulator